MKQTDRKNSTPHKRQVLFVAKYLRWTPEEDDRLKRLIEEGRSTAAIVERLKRTTEAIRNRAHLLGIRLKVRAK